MRIVLRNVLRKASNGSAGRKSVRRSHAARLTRDGGHAAAVPPAACVPPRSSNAQDLASVSRAGTSTIRDTRCTTKPACAGGMRIGASSA